MFHVNLNYRLYLIPSVPKLQLQINLIDMVCQYTRLALEALSVAYYTFYQNPSAI